MTDAQWQKMSDQRWLKSFLDRAAAANLCTTIHCTTCGAMKFRDGLRMAATLGSTAKYEPTWTVALATIMASALAKLTAETTDKHFAAVRLVLVDLWGSLGEGEFQQIVESKLGGSPVGSILQRMRNHSAERDRARQAHEESHRLAGPRREIRKVERARAHAERLDAKKVRDAEWRRRQR